MYLDLLRCNRWILYSQMHNSFKYHARRRRDTVKLELFPMAVYGAAGRARRIIFPGSYTPGRWGARAAGAEQPFRAQLRGKN